MIFVADLFEKIRAAHDAAAILWRAGTFAVAELWIGFVFSRRQNLYSRPRFRAANDRRSRIRTETARLLCRPRGRASRGTRPAIRRALGPDRRSDRRNANRRPRRGASGNSSIPYFSPVPGTGAVRDHHAHVCFSLYRCNQGRTHLPPALPRSVAARERS